MKFLEWITELVGWCRIAISPTLAGIMIGVIIYLNIPNTMGIILASLTILIGVMVGILWATKVLKSPKGTTAFLSNHHSDAIGDDKK